MPDYPGLTVSVPLFFELDGSIDFETLGCYLEDVCKNDRIYAVYAMAYNTRYRMLSISEVLEVNRFVCRVTKAHGKRVFVGHPIQVSQQELYGYLTEIAYESPDGVSMLYPERFFGQTDPIMEFIGTPKRFGLEIVVHESKLVSGFDGSLVNWPRALIERLVSELDIKALKEDSFDDALSSFIFEQSKIYDFTFILAGGGKQRLVPLLDRGVLTWLNGTTVFLPRLIDQTYMGFVSRDRVFTDFYLERIEKPFFDECVSKFGWHLAHKAALSFFGYGKPVERFPHAKVTKDMSIKMSVCLDGIASAVDELHENS